MIYAIPQDCERVFIVGYHQSLNKKFQFPETLKTKVTLKQAIGDLSNLEAGITSTINNRGFSINFRIHNASSRVEPSLKFDINAIGLPTNEVYQHTFDIID